ncbi:MAG TPA: hypothetical protein VIC84_00545, partial [Blastocatellia bacterium]
MIVTIQQRVSGQSIGQAPRTRCSLEPERLKHNLVRRLERLGYQVSSSSSAPASFKSDVSKPSVNQP